MSEPRPPSSRLNRTDLFMGLTLLLAGIKFTYGLPGVLDIELYDESSYLHAGAALARGGLPRPEYSPFYAVWYYVLSLVQPDRINLYYLDYALTTVLPPLGVYLVLRLYRVPIVAAVLIAAYLLISQALFVTWPRPTHLALLIVLAALAVASFMRRPSACVLAVAAGALLTAYVRPEYFLAFLLLLVFGAALCVAEQRRRVDDARRGWIALGAVVLLAGLLMGALGLPAFGRGGGERHFFAFAQHYALNWADWQGLAPNGPYNPATNFREITAQSFGNVTSVGEAARHHPAAFARHVLTNLRRALPCMPGLFMHHEDLFLPNSMTCENMEARLLLLALLALAWFRRRTWLPNVRKNGREHWLLAVCVALLCVLPAIASLEIFPHDHYLLLPGTLLIVLAAVLCSRSIREQPFTAWQTALLAAGLLAAMPALSHRQAVPTPIAATIRSIESLGLTSARVNLLDIEGGYDFYQTANFHRVAEYDKHGPFGQFVAAEGINMIVWTDRLARDSRFVDDPEWRDFLAHHQTAGFRVRRVPGTDVQLLIKEDLLGPPPAG